MSQYANLFRSTRVPKPAEDALVVAPSSSHVVVQVQARPEPTLAVIWPEAQAAMYSS